MCINNSLASEDVSIIHYVRPSFRITVYVYNFVFNIKDLFVILGFYVENFGTEGKTLIQKNRSVTTLDLIKCL